MPKLLYSIPCEKVLSSQDGSVSLIGLLLASEMGATIAADTAPEVLEHLRIPIRWCLFTLWAKQLSDEGKEFTQTVQLIAPSGKIVMDAPVQFIMARNLHQIITNTPGFPVGEEGEYAIKVLLGESGSDTPAVELLSIPFSVTHRRPSPDTV